MVTIFAGVNGFLDKIAVGDITRYETALLEEIRAKHGNILADIRTAGAISEATDAKLREVVDAFTKTFA